jgi:hypothetical protein
MPTERKMTKSDDGQKLAPRAIFFLVRARSLHESIRNLRARKRSKAIEAKFARNCVLRNRWLLNRRTLVQFADRPVTRPVHKNNRKKLAEICDAWRFAL